MGPFRSGSQRVGSSTLPTLGAMPARAGAEIARAPAPLEYQDPTFLVCPPTFFAIQYEINPFMSQENAVDHSAAYSQWDDWCTCLGAAGAELVEQAPVLGLPDLVFTANAGFVFGQDVYLSQFAHAERAAEASVGRATFEDAGLTVAELPVEAGSFEGAGDAVIFREAVIGGFGQRSDRRALECLSEAIARPLVALELVDPRFFHLDLAFTPLSDEVALIVPAAFREEGLRDLLAIVPNPISLTLMEGLMFSANAVVLGSTVFMSSATARLRALVERAGFEIALSPVTEFEKAGGSLRCLTLRLDDA